MKTLLKSLLFACLCLSANLSANLSDMVAYRHPAMTLDIPLSWLSEGSKDLHSNDRGIDYYSDKYTLEAVVLDQEAFQVVADVFEKGLSFEEVYPHYINIALHQRWEPSTFQLEKSHIELNGQVFTKEVGAVKPTKPHSFNTDRMTICAYHTFMDDRVVLIHAFADDNNPFSAEELMDEVMRGFKLKEVILPGHELVELAGMSIQLPKSWELVKKNIYVSETDYTYNSPCGKFSFEMSVEDAENNLSLEEMVESAREEAAGEDEDLIDFHMEVVKVNATPMIRTRLILLEKEDLVEEELHVCNYYFKKGDKAYQVYINSKDLAALNPEEVIDRLIKSFRVE